MLRKTQARRVSAVCWMYVCWPVGRLVGRSVCSRSRASDRRHTRIDCASCRAACCSRPTRYTVYVCSRHCDASKCLVCDSATDSTDMHPTSWSDGQETPAAGCLRHDAVIIIIIISSSSSRSVASCVCPFLHAVTGAAWRHWWRHQRPDDRGC